LRNCWPWAGVAALFLVSWLGVNAVGADAPRNVSVEPATVDFGELPQGRIVRQKVKLRNTNAAAVRIVKAQTSCACLKVAAFPAEIPANGVADAELLIETLTLTGKAEKQALFTLEGAATGVLLVPTSVTVKPVPAQVLLTPAIAHCGTIWTTKETRVEVTVANLTQGPMEIRGLSCDTAGVTAQWGAEVQRLGAGEVATLTITVKGGQLKPGPLDTGVKLVTSLPLHQTILIPVRGTVVAPPAEKPVAPAPAP